MSSRVQCSRPRHNCRPYCCIGGCRTHYHPALLGIAASNLSGSHPHQSRRLQRCTVHRTAHFATSTSCNSASIFLRSRHCRNHMLYCCTQDRRLCSLSSNLRNRAHTFLDTSHLVKSVEIAENSQCWQPDLFRVDLGVLGHWRQENLSCTDSRLLCMPPCRMLGHNRCLGST